MDPQLNGLLKSGGHFTCERLVERSQSLGVCPWKVYSIHSSFHSVCFLTTMPLSKRHCSTKCSLTWCFKLAKAQEQGPKWPCAENNNSTWKHSKKTRAHYEWKIKVGRIEVHYEPDSTAEMRQQLDLFLLGSKSLLSTIFTTAGFCVLFRHFIIWRFLHKLMVPRVES